MWREPKFWGVFESKLLGNSVYHVVICMLLRSAPHGDHEKKYILRLFRQTKDMRANIIFWFKYINLSSVALLLTALSRIHRLWASLNVGNARSSANTPAISVAALHWSSHIYWTYKYSISKNKSIGTAVQWTGSKKKMHSQMLQHIFMSSSYSSLVEVDSELDASGTDISMKISTTLELSNKVYKPWKS